MTDTVKQGILLRHRVGTVAAVEYLAARDIDTAIIRRVVHGQSLREGDRIALARQQQSHAALAV